MPRMTTESFGSGDQSWLGSAYAIWNCRTDYLVVADFTPVNGVIKSGTPLTKKPGGGLAPYTGTGSLVGFLFTDQTVAGAGANINAPVLDHGRIKVAALPVSFTAPAAADDKTTCVYI